MSNLIKKVYRLLRPISLAVFSMVIYVFKYRKFKAIPSVKKGFEDNRSRALIADAQYMTIFERLLDSYNKAKAEQENIGRPYRVGPLWQDIVNAKLRQISAALRNRDTATLQAILENFHREECSSGTGGGIRLLPCNEENPILQIPICQYLVCIL